jgi:hypothetical protein
MKIRVAKLVSGPLAVSVLLSGCGPTGVDTGSSTGIGAALGAGLGYAIDDNNRGRGAVIGGLLGAGAGYLFARSYNASQQQRMQAEQVGNAVMVRARLVRSARLSAPARVTHGTRAARPSPRAAVTGASSSRAEWATAAERATA